MTHLKPFEVKELIVNHISRLKENSIKPSLDNVFIDETDNLYIKEKIDQGIKEFNKIYLKKWESKNISLYIKDLSGEIIAGLHGNYVNEYMRISNAWVKKQHRKQGLGTKLFKELENFARSKKCKYIQLDTYEFQALNFYIKLGYQLIATIPKWIKNYDNYNLRKEL